MKTKLLIFISLISIVVLTSGYTGENNQIKKNYDTGILSINKDYAKDWQKVDSLVKKGLPRSALKLVAKIYYKAKNENNIQQFIKANIYKIKLRSEYEEDFMKKNIDELNIEIKKAAFPTKQILHSVLAEIYWRYYQANRYKFLNRTETVNYNEEDINTWDLNKIVYQVKKNYLMSLENPDELKKIALKTYDLVLIKGKGSKKFRPGLYDFLAHRAVDFFMNAEPGLTEPAYKFELDKKEYFEPCKDFIKINILSKDSLSNKFYAIKILKDLIAFHIDDKNPQALIDVDLKRLKFLKQNSVLELKDSLYLQALLNLEKKYSDYPNSTDVSYEIANEYYKRGALYKPLESEKYKWDKKKAYQCCEAAVKRFPDSDGAKNCKILQQQIKKISLSMTTEYANPSKKPFLGLLSYKNIKKTYFRIIKINPEKDKKLKRKHNRENLIDDYLKLYPSKEWELLLPDDSDYQKHSVEIKMPELPTGYYIVLVGTDKYFSYNHNLVAYNSFWISNISYISQKRKNGIYEFYVLDREKGTPLKNVNIETYYKAYNYKKRDNEFKHWKSFKTDKQGFFEMQSLPPGSNSKSFYVKFIDKDDIFITDNYFYQFAYSSRESKKYLKTFFFTDRAIYRPGQTIFFKGIILEKEGGKYKIKPHHKTTVIFYDVNRKEISRLNLVSNDYGSFNGSFTAPVGVLNGQMHISNESGNIFFSVEEYKRPKFEVIFKKIKDSYKLGKTVKVNGIAKAYAGYNIDSAKVKYRVIRTARFPYWNYWWRGYSPTSPEMEITNGITFTNGKGEFVIDFTAIADLSIEKKYKPIFNYTIYADVTDINGETHSSQKTISAAYTALLIDVNIPENLNKDKKNEFKIKTSTLNGEFEAAKGNISIYKLKQPDKVFRERLWQRPDKFIMNKKEFHALFPYDVYNDENDISKWQKVKQVLNYNFNTKEDTLLKINNLSEWTYGDYVLKIKSKDKYGSDIEKLSYFKVFSTKAKVIPDNSPNWFYMIKDKGEPGEDISFLIGTKYKNVHVVFEIQHKDSVLSKQWLKLNNQQKIIKIPIKEKYRGNFNINLTFVKNNRSYQNESIINVPYTNKQLDFEFETFRDKLLPGDNEVWKIKIKDKIKGDKVAAEMLCSMYDESLDALRKNKWFFDIYKTYYSSISWDTRDAFKTKFSKIYTEKPINIETPVYRDYDRLNWFGFNYYGHLRYKNIDIRRQGMPVSAKGEIQGDEILKTFASDEQKETTSEQGKKLLKNEEKFMGIQLRRDFKETAFFFPNLETDEKGEIIIKFKVPESLTRWKMMGFAYTKELKYGFVQKHLTAQKNLMIIPNEPRYFRQGDTISFSAKVVDISDKELSGIAKINFFDALTMTPVDSLLNNTNAVKTFTVKKGQSRVLHWNISIPQAIEAVTYKIYAKSGSFTDAEEMTLPVLSNRLLVTESLPLAINGKQNKKYSFYKLKNSKSSKTLKNYKLTLEFTSNPAWYAIQALPYLMESPYECSEKIFSRFYANSIASYIVNSNPKIKHVFESWRDITPNALLSNLEKNQELKSLMLEETPWVLDAKNETERKQRISLLFDLNKMSDELNITSRKLQKMQTPNGGWPWFKGMKDDRYITQHIVTGFGHLEHLGIKNIKQDTKTWNMVQKAVKYLDNIIRKDYENIKKLYPDKMNGNHLGNLQVQYLYARSYFKNSIKIDDKNKKAFEYFKGQADKYWLDKNKYLQAMIALALKHYDYKTTPLDIIKSLKEKALHSDEMGMYWRDEKAGYYWYQAPVETQALLIEAFYEITNDKKSVEQMKQWLLKQKQTQNWKTSKATVEACYALLLTGTDLLTSNKLVKIKLGNIIINPKKMEDVKIEAGTGYFKTSWTGNDIKPEMGNITVTKTDEGIAWGALYWQYFENLDKITAHKTPLKLDKKLFVERYYPTGPVIEPINDNTLLKVGDKIKVRIELRVDRDMEYVHLKDMRASAFEAVNILSGYKYQDGLGYYESTLDASTNFFFNYLRKGTYVFEYPLIVSQRGDFSNGITTIQCMYAPEFTSHSEGKRLRIGE